VVVVTSPSLTKEEVVVVVVGSISLAQEEVVVVVVGSLRLAIRRWCWSAVSAWL
jgi:hypothetical protein